MNILYRLDAYGKYYPVNCPCGRPSEHTISIGEAYAPKCSTCYRLWVIQQDEKGGKAAPCYDC